MVKQKFKKQQFQEDAVNAVCDVFEGQGKDNLQYILGKKQGGLSKHVDSNIYAWKNADIGIPEETILKNLHKIQKKNDLKQNPTLEGLNFTVEMETGTGKTYVYINTIFELHKRYGWNKFLIVVPSIAIREGVKASFDAMEEHFATLYGKKIRYFIFDSSKASQLESFATNSGINVMIINNHAFNKTETNNMYKKGERGIKLIDYIIGTNPIIIIDEPQSVEGKQTKSALKEFNSSFTLRYSATPKEDYNMVYRLDAIDAFRKRLVKKIHVKGIDIKGTTATHSYLYLEGMDISKNHYPKARIEIEVKQKDEVVKKTVKVSQGDDLFTISNNLQEYKGFKVSEINANTNTITFTNGIRLFSGEVSGEVNEEHKRRIQIRETIKSHLNKESNLYEKGIKILSLFFIDEVKNYRDYDEQGNQQDGKFAKMFEEEYNNLVGEYKTNPIYKQYLEKISTERTHEGYFSIDKKGHLTNPDEKGRGENKSCDDVSAYDLIMKRKGLLLDLKEPTRFIFSHSALREGWDNPNVFQICVLRNTDPKEVRTRQEVGRGLRLCVNQNGDRIDEEFEEMDFVQANILTIIANDSYEDFAKGLQHEFSKNIKDRPSKLTKEFLLKNKLGETRISDEIATKICNDFLKNGYVDDFGALTDKYHQDLEQNKVQIREELKPKLELIVEVVKQLYDNTIKIVNEDDTNKIRNKINQTNFNHPEFKKFWEKINSKSTYTVNFDTNLLINNSVDKINQELHVVKITAEIKSGEMATTGIDSEKLKSNKAFGNEQTKTENVKSIISNKYTSDLIEKIVTETFLKRKTAIDILIKISKEKFDQFKENPEDFIIQISKIINDEKAEIIYDNIVYHKTDEKIPLDIFEKGILNSGNSIDVKRYIYDYLIYDSDNERKFAIDIDSSAEVIVFSKLPKNHYVIYTPIGRFSPDWMIVFNKDKVKYAYFIAETKGSKRGLDQRGVERIKIECAKKHFHVISDEKVKFSVVSSWDELKNIAEFIH